MVLTDLPWSPSTDLPSELSLDAADDSNTALQAALSELGTLSQQLEVPLELGGADWDLVVGGDATAAMVAV